MQSNRHGGRLRLSIVAGTRFGRRHRRFDSGAVLLCPRDAERYRPAAFGSEGRPLVARNRFRSTASQTRYYSPSASDAESPEPPSRCLIQPNPAPGSRSVVNEFAFPPALDGPSWPRVRSLDRPLRIDRSRRPACSPQGDVTLYAPAGLRTCLRRHNRYPPEPAPPSDPRCIESGPARPAWCNTAYVVTRLP
jgi:hypothetical protein